VTREVPGAMINRNLFTQVNQDSGSLTSATTVVHRFAEQGEYRGVLVDRRGVATGEFSISVGEEKRPEHQEEGGHEAAFPASVQVDLTSLQASSLGAAGHASSSASGDDDGCGCDDEEEGQGGTMRVAPQGYAVFNVPAGAAGGYAVELYKSGESGRGKKEFDSRALGESDMLAVVLLRPGTYSVTNASNGTKANLKVAYPEKAPGLLEPVKVVCAADGIRPNDIRVHPTQGLVFSFETPSRVKIDLVAPEDRARPSAPAAPPKAASQGTTTAKKHSRRLQLYPRRLVRH
jgi:hypothetical protein